MVIQLIAKDKNEKFQGKCKLIIDSLSKLLLVEPYNEDFKMISAMFKWEFVAQKNILFIFAEYAFQDFVLIFDNSEKCKKAIGFLLKKGATAGKKEHISQRFLPSILSEVSTINESNLKIKEIFLKWIEFFDGKEKETFIQILKDYNVYDLFSSNTVGELPINTRKRKVKEISNFKENCLQSNISCKKRIVEAPNFEILKYIQNGRLRKKLSIFPDSNDRKYCYEFFWQNSHRCYICHPCSIRKKHVVAKIIKRNGKDIVQLNRSDHSCKLRKCKEIIEKSNFEVTSFEYRKAVFKKLIVFLDSTRDYCYEYSWCNSKKAFLCRNCVNKKYRIRANICQKEDGTEFVMLKSSQHLCDPRKYNPEKYGEKEIVEASNFKIFKDFLNGIDKSKLVIFTSSDQSMCYEYFFYNRQKYFLCCNCWKQHKYVYANVCKNENGNDYLKLNKEKHVCEPLKYDPDKFEPSEKQSIESSNFKIFHFNHHGKSTSKLIVFDPTNMNLCYEYYFNKFCQIYQCSYCPVKNQVTAAVIKNNGSNNSLALLKNQHICELREFDPEKYKDDIILEKSMYKFLSTKLGKNEKFLIIFTSEEKRFYYKFLYKNQKKCYYCSKCYSSYQTFITATIQNEENENECVFVSSQKHVCEPLNYSTLTNRNFIKSPNFQLTKRNLNGKFTQHLIVFTNDKKTDYYDYAWKKNCFACNGCKNQHKIHIYAKIFKNDANEECVELSPKPHKCKPINCEIENPKIVKLPDFKLYDTSWGKKHVKRLDILDSKNHSMGYIYAYQEQSKKYYCRQCKNKKTWVTAKVLQDERGENYLELNNKEHVCELQKL